MGAMVYNPIAGKRTKKKTSACPILIRAGAIIGGTPTVRGPLQSPINATSGPSIL